MDIAKTYWLLKNNINQPVADYYKTSNKTPYERGVEALDYYRYYGGKPLNIEKTYLNRLIMPIFEDLDLFELKITKKFVKMKETQDNFNSDEAIKDLQNLTKIVAISIKENIKNKKSLLKDINKDYKSIKEETDEILKEGVKKRKIIKPFLQFMEHRELDDQDLMNKITSKFITNKERIRKFKENMMIEDNLKEKDDEKNIEKFNDYIVEFKKNLESKNRRMKIERLKMKINDIQQNLEKEMLEKKEIPKIKRKVISVGFYGYNPNNDNSLNTKKIFSINSKSKSKSISSFSKYIKEKLSEGI